VLPTQQPVETEALNYQQLEEAILTLESYREAWGSEIVDTATAPFKEKLGILLARQLVPEQQRKFVSVLFVDIAKSTEKAQKLELEYMSAFLNQAIYRFERIVNDNQGQVLEKSGDGLMAVFGIPNVKEDDAVRAVRAGYEMLAEAIDYGRHAKRRWGIEDFSIRVGVNTGPIIYGPGVGEEQFIMGMTVNLARRMEQNAPAGGLRITHDTFQQIHGVFDVDPQPLLSIKGKDEPIQTYLVTSAQPPAYRMYRHGIAGMPAQMVGRAVEFDRLCKGYENTRLEGKANFITIVGNPGIGKSRLLIEFEEWLAGQSEVTARFRGRGFRPQQSAPYWVIRMFITNHCRIHDRDPMDIVRLKLETTLSRHLESDPLKKSHIIGALLGYSFRESPYLRGILDDSQQLRDQGLHYLTEFFLNIMNEGVTTLLVEDIHWADDPSLEFLKELERTATDRPLLVIYLARPELLERYPQWFTPEELASTRHIRLNLRALSREDSNSLVAEILKEVEALPSSLVATIASKADGNPLYIEELIKMLTDEDVLIEPADGEIWRVDSFKLSNFRVPQTLIGVLQSRLDKLPVVEKLYLQQASVVGRTFWEGALEDGDKHEGDIQPVLETLVRRGHLYRKDVSTFAEEFEYSFNHVLLRDVTYETVLIWNRKRYHARTADWLSNMTGKTGRQDEFAAVIAEHHEFGEEADKAAAWYLRAGEKAKDQGALLEAARFFDRALSLIPLDANEKRLAVLFAKEGVLDRLASFKAQHAVIQSIIEIATELDDVYQLARANSRMGFCLRNLGRYDEEITAYESAIDAAQESGNRAIEAHSLSLFAHSLLRQGDITKASRFAEKAMRTATTLDDDTYRAKSLTNIANYYSESGDIAKAAQLFSEIAAICSHLELAYGEAVNLSNLGYNYILLGLSELAITPLNQAIEISESIGARHQESYCQLNLGLANYRMGQLSQAKTIIENAKAVFEKRDDRFGQASGSLYLGLIHEGIGDCDNSFERFNKAVELFEDIGIPGYAIDAKAGAARFFLNQGKQQRALRFAEIVWDYLSSSGSQGLEFPSMAYKTCVQAFTAQGDTTLAARSKEAGIDNLREQAEGISDPLWRRSYLRNIPEHQMFRNTSKE
jgi:predicted ATPase/class 3 adenylate cyclase